MKIICINEPGFFIEPDTALLRNNEPFWMPCDNVDYRTGKVVRISRVAKCVDERFAHRCYCEAGAGVDFSIRGEICEAAARSFDHSFAVSPTFVPCTRNATIDKHIAYVTKFVTLKIGDLLFISDGEFKAAHSGDRIMAGINGEILLDFDIK